MIDLRPVFNIIGWLLIALGSIMLVPMAVDLALGSDDWLVFIRSAFLTAGTGLFVVLATANSLEQSLSIRQSFLMTIMAWLVMPFFGAIPLEFALDHISVTDAVFEAMSGMTTTGSTVLEGLDDLPPGVLLWRSILQWLGGLGIIIVALIFLPVMKVGGMQHFRSEGFDTMGKVLPRSADISWMLLQVYAGLTILCAALYLLEGSMTTFEAVNHALTTVSTGGFSTRDSSFAQFDAASHWICTLFMWLAGLPFIRYVQLVNGSVKPLWQDIQIRAYARWTVYAVALVIIYRLIHGYDDIDEVIRESTFNIVSLFSGTGFGSADISSWGDFAILVAIVAGFTGACTASTGCSIKVFRFLVLFAAIKAQLRQLVYPNRVIPLQLGGRRLENDVVVSVVVMFSAFVLGFGVLTALLALTGLEMRTAFTAAWTSLCNIGPAWGGEVGPTGAMHAFPWEAKWLMIFAMLFGRLEVIAVVVILLPRFWRS